MIQEVIPDQWEIDAILDYEKRKKEWTLEFIPFTEEYFKKLSSSNNKTGD